MRRLSTASVVDRAESGFERSDASDDDLEERMILSWTANRRKSVRPEIFKEAMGAWWVEKAFKDVSK